MGKRRTNAPHKDRYAGGDSDDSEGEDEVVEQPELSQEQLASIKTRKKLIAKRRGPSETAPSSFGAFGALTKAGQAASAATDDSDKPAPSVFSGFKGFSAFKASTPAVAPVPTANSSTSLFSAAPKLTAPVEAPKTTTPFASFSFTSDSSKPSLSAQPTNGDHGPKTNDTTTIPKPTETKKPEQTDDSGSNNISENELNFINELNVVYEKYYGKTKRVLKLPAEIVNQDMDKEKSEESLRKKYGFLLAELNKHCSKWISKHVEEDPLIVLTPIFIDYFNYMILMEKNFYPSTFKAKSMNGGLTTTTTATTTPFLSKPTNGTAATSFSSVNKMNGHKEDFNSLDEKNQDKENEEAENDKKLIDSSKSFANLIKTNQMNPISLTGSTITAAFTFKASESPKLAEKDSNSTTPTQQSSMFKFGGAPTTKTNQSPFGANTLTTAAATPKTEEPKLAFQSTGSADLNKVAPTFKFGSSTTETNKPSSTPTESIFQFAKKPETTTPSLFGKPAENSTATPLLFGKSTESPQTSLFSKPTTAATPSMFSKPAESTTSTTTPSSIFSNASKSVEAEEKTEEKPKEETKPTEPTFSSLMNANQSGGSTGFKGFSGFGSSIGSTAPSSLFSASATTGSESAPKPVFSGFSFAGAAAGTAPASGLFGASTTGSSLFGGASTFQAGAAAPQQEEEEEYVPPKPETSDVKEEGAVFEKRMKLYYYNEKESKFCDRGIGNLYLKPTSDGASTSLIIRADTKLATILMNVKLSKALPISKISAKDVSFLCVPNPAIPGVEASKPCKFLFKVKTEDDAIELVDKLNEYKR